MNIGVGPFTCQKHPNRTTSYHEIYSNMIELAIYAEKVGIDSVWVSEHHFTDSGYVSGPIPSLGAIASVTETIGIGSSIIISPLHNPIELAEELATIDIISDGRLTAGMGLGYREIEYDGYEKSMVDRAQAIEDQVQLLRGSWSEGPIGLETELYDVPSDITVTPKPKRVPPIYLAGQSRPAIHRAIEIADGWIAPPGLSLQEMKTRVEDIKSVRDKRGIHSDFRIIAGARGFIADSEAEAWNTIEDGYLYMMEEYSNLKSEPASVTPSELREAALLGSPTEVAEELTELRRLLEYPIDFIYRIFFPGVCNKKIMRCLEVLGDEVIDSVGVE